MPAKDMFFGVTALLPTPFLPDGAVDWLSFDRILERQACAGCAVAICTKTGERSALGEKERRQLVDEAVLVCRNRVKVYAGIGAEEGENAVEAGVCASESGADGLILEDGGEDFCGFYSLVQKLSRTCRLPLAVERRAGKKSLALFPELAAIDRLSAVADGFCTPLETARLYEELQKRDPSPILVCSNEETAFLCRIFQAKGVFSRLAACDPLTMKSLWKEKNAPDAFGAFRRKAALFSALHGENGVPTLKRLLSVQGLCSPAVRLPLVALTVFDGGGSDASGGSRDFLKKVP